MHARTACGGDSGRGAAHGLLLPPLCDQKGAAVVPVHAACSTCLCSGRRGPWRAQDDVDVLLPC